MPYGKEHPFFRKAYFARRFHKLPQIVHKPDTGGQLTKAKVCDILIELVYFL